MGIIPGSDIIPAIGGAVCTAAIGWLLHVADVDILKHRQAVALADLNNQLVAQCERDKAITKEANDDLQRQKDIISNRLNDALRVQPSLCIVPQPAHAADTAASGAKHAGQNGRGINSSWLRRYAAECETYRQQRLTLEKFIDEVWKDQSAIPHALP